MLDESPKEEEGVEAAVEEVDSAVEAEGVVEDSEEAAAAEEDLEEVAAAADLAEEEAAAAAADSEDEEVVEEEDEVSGAINVHNRFQLCDSFSFPIFC